MDIAGQYLESTRKTFANYKTMAEKAIAQLEPEQLFIGNENSNSIAIIMQHLSGNMLSRWTDFLSSDGEKPWRQRDEEFEEVIKTKEDLMQKWEEGWVVFLKTLDDLKPEDVGQTVYIRSEAHTVMEAINRQLAHYSYHIGQIVYVSKMLKRGEWSSLSIPKNKSKQFNAEKFSQSK
jgi:hypothetical protein